MEKYSSTQVKIRAEAQKTLLTDVSKRPNVEACGVLLGSIDELGNWLVEEAQPLPNIFNSPVYFEFAPEDLLNIEIANPGRIVGVYHSHPTGFPVASSTDRQNMQRVNLEQGIPWVWLIISGPFDEAFIQRTQGHITGAPIIAYHHYQKEGLLQVTIDAEEAHSATDK